MNEQPQKYYHVTDCQNEENSFDMRYDAVGAFEIKAFDNQAFDIHSAVYLDTNKEYMLESGKCVVMDAITPTVDIFNKEEADNNILNYTSFLVIADTCNECNKVGYSITDSNGIILYPANSDELKDYLGKYIKFKTQDGLEYCGYVGAYKYYKEKKTEPIIVTDGCYETFDSCDSNKKIKEEKEFDIRQRNVNPGEHVKKCWSC